MEADIHELYVSDFYRLLDFKCRCTDCRVSKPEYSDSFCISFIRKGNFLFNVFRHSYDSHTGRILVTKPGFEHTVAHIHTVPDECTIFDFKRDLFQELAGRYNKKAGNFFEDRDLHSLMLTSNIHTDYLHHRICQLTRHRRTVKLEIDSLVIELIESVVRLIAGNVIVEPVRSSLKKQHLGTIEIAKAYISEFFTTDISLREIAQHCHVSPFHFSRIFKTFTGYSPHQYLLQLRLAHAGSLLLSSSNAITDISFSCGFNSLEHFSSLFSQKNGLSPTQYRENQGSPRVRSSFHR